MLRRHAMTIAGFVMALCTLTSEPQHAEASGGGRVREVAPAKRDLRPAARQVVHKPAAASVVGRVVDVLGNAVADVTVVATPGWLGETPPSQPAPRVRTDGTGRFRFIGLPPGEYVFVTIHGHHAASVSPAMPVDAKGSRGLEVVLIVGGLVLSA